MNLRSKLVLAFAPLTLALIITAVAGGYFLRKLGHSTERVLADNYRTVLAVQRMTEAIDLLDGSSLSVVGQGTAPNNAADQRARFETELRVQEGNITEPGEDRATQRLRQAWTHYSERYDRFLSLEGAAARRTAYFDGLRPAYEEVKRAAEPILVMNQDAIVRKSDEATRIADRSVTLLVVVSVFGLLLALYASSSITSRTLRPLSVLGQATRRLGEGDLATRAVISGKDEIASLAADFNAMAEHLQRYRQSSLGELLEAQQASQAAIDSLPDPVLVLGVDGQLLHTNRPASSILRITVEGGLGAIDPAVREVIDRVAQHIAAGRGPYTPRGLDESFRVLTSDGERHLLPRATPVYAEEGNVVGTTLVLQDVTRLLRFEELRNNLVATVAHELRTPLTSLRMAIHLLTEQLVGPLTAKQADLVFAAREDCDRLQSTVDELLDLSRIQAGRLELRTRPSDAEALVREALETQRAAAAGRQVQLRSEALPGLGQVVADVDRVSLVFANLLNNALRHSPPGGTITMRAVETNGSVRFEVQDEGPGVPKEYQQAIFEKYFQLPNAPAGGAGLGLFIAKEIVQAHGGEIGVQNAPGQGATFWFTLPRAPTSESRS